MFENKRRNNWTYFVKESIKILKGLNFILLLALINIKDNGIFVIIGLLILSIVIGLIKFSTTKFYVIDNVFILQKGGMVKKKLELPFDKINTVDQEQNIIDRIFNVCSIKIDSGANKLAAEEVKLQLRLDESKALKEIILKDKKEKNSESVLQNSFVNKTKDYIYEKVATVKELFVYGLTKGKLLGTVSFIFIVIGLSGTLNDVLDYNILSKIIGYAEENTTQLLKTKIAIILFVIILLLGSYIVINIITIGYEVIRLYNFKICCDEKNIYISYGFFKTKNYTIAINKIHSLKINQSLIQQYFKLYTIEVIAIGYGDEKKEKAIIFPIANSKLLNEIIENVLPDFKENVVKHKQSLKSIKLDTTIGIIIYMVIALIAILLHADIIIILAILSILVIIVLAITILNYKNTSIGVDNNLLFISQGALLKKTNIIKQSSLQSIEILQGPIGRKIGAVKFMVNIYTNKLLEFVVVSNIEKSLEKEIIDNMDI